jgi:hypothetical protein
MKAYLRGFALLPLLIALLISSAQGSPKKLQEKPLTAAVCTILADPSSFDNKLVTVRAVIHVSSEYATIEDNESRCGEAIWIVLGSFPAPLGLLATVNGSSSPKTASREHESSNTISITLSKDRSYDTLMQYLSSSEKGNSCVDQPGVSSIPDCTTYRVTATFTGRLDSVPKAVRAAHLRRGVRDAPDFVGYGHMGMFDAQLVVRSVEKVEAHNTISEPH